MPGSPYPALTPDRLPAGAVVGWSVTARIAVAVDESREVILITPAGSGDSPLVRSAVEDTGQLTAALRLASLYVAAVFVRRARAPALGALPPGSDPAVRHAAFLALVDAGRMAPAIEAVDAEAKVSGFVLDYAARYPRTGFSGHIEATAIQMSLFAATWVHHPARELS